MLINAERQIPLVVDKELTYRAEQRAVQLCKDKQWSHDGWKNSFKGMNSKFLGENLARNFNDATSTHKALMNSPTHKANLVRKEYKYVGIGKSCNITVQLFKS